MEWNGKSPLQWDWENLMMFNGASSENPKKMREMDLEFVGDKGINSGSLDSSGHESVSGGSGSDFELTCLSKSSKSASISSCNGELRNSKLNSEASPAQPVEFVHKEESEKTKMISTSPKLEASVGSAESLLGLKLGKRMYFEDVCAGNNPKTSSSSVTPVTAVTNVKRSKASHHSIQAPLCQVEGCDLDLSSAKDYHRKHRVCQSHSRCPKVIVGGLERRFCQQCSRFHCLSEFDEKKRSCRRRLSDHNARRRKPQLESTHLNPAGLSRSLYDSTQHMNVVWNRAPLVSSRPNADLALEGLSSSKFTIVKDYIHNPENMGEIHGQLHFAGNEMTTSMPMDHHDANSFFASKVKSPTTQTLNQGLEEPMISSSVDTTPYLHRALSLLSTNPWSSCEPKSASLEQSIRPIHASMPQPVPHAMSQGLPLSSLGYRRTKQHSIDNPVQTLASHSSSSNSYAQEFQLLRTPYETDLYANQLN